MDKKIQDLWEKVKDLYCCSLEESIHNSTESPIEQLLLLGLLSNLPYFELSYKHDKTGFKEFFKSNDGMIIESQVEITPKIRVDFLITFEEHFCSDLKIIIECDGHDFHEKTKEQVRKDKQRERELVKLGFIILRYSGSEIFENPNKCYEDLEELIEKEFKEVRH